MHKNHREDIFTKVINYNFISLISEKIRVAVIGGGEAGFIKTKAFLNRGCKVWVISKDFCEEFNNIEDENVILINDSYKKHYIIDKHLIVIAIDSEEGISSIIDHCKELSKLYLNCRNFKEGNFVVPMQKETSEISFALNTKKGSPKTSKYLSQKFKALGESYDEFVSYTCNIREEVKHSPLKKEVMNFICSDEFKFFYDKGYGDMILTLFYSENIK